LTKAASWRAYVLTSAQSGVSFAPEGRDGLLSYLTMFSLVCIISHVLCESDCVIQ
jgi:hypothetical protein